MSGVKVGDEVRLLRQRRRRGPHVPDDGWPGTVIKIGRTYATGEFRQKWADPDGTERSGTVTLSFNMEAGTVRGDTEGLYVRTPEQLDGERRRKEAIYVLGLAGLEFKLGYAHFLTTEQIEALAEVVKTWDE